LKYHAEVGSVSNRAMKDRFGTRLAPENHPSAGRQRKKSRFLKYFQKKPKVPQNAAVNDYMNGKKPPGRAGKFLKYFSKMP
jgi:hypothetical protein